MYILVRHLRGSVRGPVSKHKVADNRLGRVWDLFLWALNGRAHTHTCVHHTCMDNTHAYYKSKLHPQTFIVVLFVLVPDFHT